MRLVVVLLAGRSLLCDLDQVKILVNGSFTWDPSIPSVRVDAKLAKRVWARVGGDGNSGWPDPDDVMAYLVEHGVDGGVRARVYYTRQANLYKAEVITDAGTAACKVLYTSDPSTDVHTAVNQAEAWMKAQGIDQAVDWLAGR